MPSAVSVIVPTRNRPLRLAACLTALAAQSFPRNQFEVIVVDDGSDTSMESIVEGFHQSLDVHLIRQVNTGPAGARNAGAAHASGALLAFTDDDCEADVDWVEALHSQSKASPNCLIGGHTVNRLEQNVYSTASQLLIDYLHLYHHGRDRERPNAVRAAPAFFTSNNIAVPTALFKEVGGFDPSFPIAAGEDREFCDRWQHSGYRLIPAPRARVSHSHALSLTRFWRQHWNYGRGAWYFQRARLARRQKPLGIEPLSFYWRLVTYPIRLGVPSRVTALVGLLCLSQVANTLGFAAAKYRRQPSR